MLEDELIRAPAPPAPPQAETTSSPVSPPGDQSLPALYADEFLKLRERFETTGDGCAALRARADLIDGIVQRLQRELLPGDASGAENFCLVALGGYGRQELFPYSDIDLLFLFSHPRAAESARQGVAALSRALWDLHLRVGPTTRTLAECGELHRDNLELNLALLDCRCLAGDLQLFAALRDEVIPHFVARDRRELLRELSSVTAQRHAKHARTLFHLEPNIKETPGGLRDYHVCRWLAQIAELDRHRRWASPEKLWPAPLGAEAARSFEFLCALRCFMHFAQGRDDNQLSYELQERAAARGVGGTPGVPAQAGPPRPAAEWMRDYFRHARSIHRLTTRLLEETAPRESSLYSLFQDWRARLSNADFSVLRGHLFVRQPSALREDPSLLLGLFEMAARHGLDLSREAEKAVEDALRRADAEASHLPAEVPGLWAKFQRLLVLPHAAGALRVMHRLGLLAALFPEFRAIDALVVRDFYHRYTVDEHTFMAIQSLHALAAPRSREAADREPLARWERLFAEIWSELEQPGLLLFALLFHDVGKGLPESGHVGGSLQALESALSPLDVPFQEKETVRFLILHHLEMSATCQRRDVFDPETVRAFAERAGTPERLKMLCLLTYADLQAVNPEALTPWRAELLWQLYAGAVNYLARSVDDQRVEAAETAADGEAAQIARLVGLLRAPSEEPELRAFLQGFPRRYLASHSPQEVAGHFEMARRLSAPPAGGSAGKVPVQVNVTARNHHFELTVLTPDRPFLFASLTGTLAAWGMNIIKADAFANARGMVLDTFRFVDLHHTLELNPSEKERLEADLVAVLNGELDVARLMSGRVRPALLSRVKVSVATQLRFDDESSSHATLVEIIAQDRPGLLYQLSSRLAELGCNIEVALIDTEGQKAIDVFYLTFQGAKLDAARKQAVREALLQSL